MRSPGWMRARPMKPLVDPAVAGVSRARMSLPRLRLGSVSLRSTMRGWCLIMLEPPGVARTSDGTSGNAGGGGPSGARRAPVGDGQHVGVRQEAVDVAFRLQGAFDADRGAVEEALQFGCLLGALEAQGGDG